LLLLQFLVNTGSSSLLAVLSQIPVDVAFLGALIDFSSFIVFSFSLGKGQLDLCKTSVVEVNPQRYQSEASLLKLGSNPANFSLVQQQFSFSVGIVVGRPGLGVLGDFAANQPALAPLQSRVRAVKVGLAKAKRFDLASQKGKTGFKSLDQLIIAESLFMDDPRCPFIFVLARFGRHARYIIRQRVI